MTAEFYVLLLFETGPRNILTRYDTKTVFVIKTFS